MLRHLTQSLCRRASILSHAPPRLPSFSFARPGASTTQQLTLARSYLGEAEDSAPKLSPEEEKLLRIAKPKSEEILQKHVAMPNLKEIPSSSFDPTSSVDDDSLNLEIRRKRLVYRSKQRGWLEVDLLLGTWASENVPTLNHDELDQYESFVNQETIDIYNVITLRTPIPDEIKNPIVERIQAWASQSPLGKADPETYKYVKANAKLI